MSPPAVPEPGCYDALPCRWRTEEERGGRCTLSMVHVGRLEPSFCALCLWRDRGLGEIMEAFAHPAIIEQMQREAFPQHQHQAVAATTQPSRVAIDVPPMPGLLERARNYAAHLARVARAEATGIGAGTRSESEMRAILAICRRCPSGLFDGSHCRACGCPADLGDNPLENLLAHRSTRCKMGHWG